MTVKNDSARIQKEFGDDVEHIHGNLFRVRRSSIRLAKKGVSSSEGRLVYGNPRWFVNSSGEQEAKGVDRSKMEELKGSIRERGMDHPIRLRATKDGSDSPCLEMINGERRYLALCELCDDEAECFDQTSKDMRPASEVHEWVECRVEYMDDKTALRCALKLNETSEVIGETASINVVRVLRESGYDDQEIMMATGKSLSWLRETDRIIGLDETCLENLHSDRINRTVALRLALIKNVEERVSTLEKIKEAAEIRHSEKMRKSKSDIEKAVEDAHLEEAHADMAEEDGDEEAAKRHKAKSEASKKKADKMDAEVRSQEGKKAKATAKDMQKATASSQPVSSSKIKSLYLKPLRKIIEEGGARDGGDDLDTVCLMFLEAMLNAIMDGRTDFLAVLDEHCPLASQDGDYSESESEYIEASDDEEGESEEDSDIEASDDEEGESEEDSDIEASDDEEDESEEDSDIEASDDEEDEEYDSYVASEGEGSYEEVDEMNDDLEREFQEEARALGQGD